MVRDWADDEPAFDDWDAWSIDQTEKPRSTTPAIQMEREREYGNGNGTGKGKGASDTEPSPKQVDYLVSLIGQDAADAVRFTKVAYSAAIDAAVPDKPARKSNRYGGKCVRCHQRVEAEAGLLTGSAGSWGVEHDGACPEHEPEPEPEDAEPEPDLQGIHRTDDDVIYKVQIAVHGSGHPYAKRLDTDAEGGPSFEYAPGALRKLSVDTLLTIEEAKEWGILYGVCCVCGRTLTRESSIAAGIGPVCAKSNQF